MGDVMDLVIRYQNDELEQENKGEKAQHFDGGFRYAEHTGHYQQNEHHSYSNSNTHVLKIMPAPGFSLQTKRFAFLTPVLIVYFQRKQVLFPRQFMQTVFQ